MIASHLVWFECVLNVGYYYFVSLLSHTHTLCAVPVRDLSLYNVLHDNCAVFPYACTSIMILLFDYIYISFSLSPLSLFLLPPPLSFSILLYVHFLSLPPFSLVQVMNTTQWLYLVTEYASGGEIFG